MEQSRERSNSLPYTSVWKLSKREPSGHPRLKGDNFTLRFYLFIYFYVSFVSVYFGSEIYFVESFLWGGGALVRMLVYKGV